MLRNIRTGGSSHSSRGGEVVRRTAYRQRTIGRWPGSKNWVINKRFFVATPNSHSKSDLDALLLLNKHDDHLLVGKRERIGKRKDWDDNLNGEGIDY
jgi:hypothetical protein